MRTPRFISVADRAVLVEFGDRIDDRLNRLVGALDRAIADASIAGVVETVPALVNILVVFDPLATDHAEVEAALRRLFPLNEAAATASRSHVAEVCYDAELCPDLARVAQAKGLTVEEVIAAHTSAEFRVSMYGFAPGYAYLTGLPEAIQTPRKPTPVRDVPKGSVLIAGPQCLVTTLTMPTGWSIIGRSPTEILLKGQDARFLFDVGDSVTFTPVPRGALPEELQTP